MSFTSKEDITVISSFATDTILRDDGIHNVEGGPALFIKNCFDNLKVRYRLVSGVKGQVVIDLRRGNRKGLTEFVGDIELRENPKGLVLISTLLSEFPLRPVGDFCCVDLQGYLRCNSDFSKKIPLVEKPKGFDVLKLNQLEFEFLQKDWIKDFPLLLVTCDERGYEIYRYGKRRFVNIIPMEVDDSIGAGDTFFAAFSLKYFETRDAFSSAEFAHEITKEFLNKKSG